MQERKSCLVCGNSELKTYLKTKDYFGSQELFTLVECSHCNTLYTSPFPDNKEIITYYKSNSYVSHGDKKGLLFDTIYSSIKRINISNKYKVLTRHISTKTHLDIGCGTGDFLYYLENKGLITQGVEIDDSARQIAQQKNLDVKSNIGDIKDQKFDSISMIHVLEHVHEFDTNIQFVQDHLNPGGILFLALPNYMSQDAQTYGNHWAGYDVPRHLHHFSPKSIETLSERFGLKLVATHPMKFDSYYTSLLSHKYLTGRTNYLKAFINGFRSNIKARKNGNFSSLIYILQK